MHIRHWKKRRFPYNPEPPRIQRFAQENNAPHAQFRVIYIAPTKKHPEPQYIRSGCQCAACIVYLQQIARYNPERFHAMCAPWPTCNCQTCNDRRERGNSFSRKSLPEHVHTRRNLAKSFGNWRG